MRVLLVGRLPAVADLGRTLLQLEYEVETHSSPESAVQAWSHGRCETALFSMSRADAPSFETVKTFRETRPEAPIVIVSDMTHVDERVAGLDAGADHYITAPFAAAELRARLSAVARSTALHLPEEIRVGPLLMREGDPTVTVGGRRVDMTPRERTLLELIAVAAPNVVSKSAIAKKLSIGEPASNAAIEILIHRLRRRLAPASMSIVTSRGVGYQLRVADEPPGSYQSNQPSVPLNSHNAERPDIPLGTELKDTDQEPWNTRLLEFTNDAIIIWEMQGRGILYWNSGAERLYGYDRGEAHRRTTHDLLRTQLAGGVTSLERDLARYGVWIGELTHTTRTGQRVLVEGRLALMPQRNNRWLVLEVNRDITDRNAAESSRREMERRLQDLRAQTGAG